MQTLSPAQLLASLSEEEREAHLATLSTETKAFLRFHWRFWARPKQVAPEGDWALWIIRAGRGFGKTRSGSGWVHERAMAFPGRWIALVARTPADARDYMIEGPGGLLRNTAPHERPDFEPSKRRLTWPNGSWATIYSDEEPDQCRGFSGDTAWLDEFAKFKHAREGWDNLQLGMREASTDRPRRLITTTPRPIPLLRELEKKPTTRVVIGTSHENRSNLDPTWYEETILGYEGTRIGRQEVNAEYVDDVPGALWTRDTLDSALLKEDQALPEMVRIVVAVDPSGTKGEADEQANDVGIIVVSVGIDGRGYVLADRSCNLSPLGWARRVVDTYHEFEADRIVAETNFGGAMVEAVIRGVDDKVPFAEVKASRGKAQRAEPVAALYERGEVSHVKGLAKLEDQMTLMTSSGYTGEGSPDRVDAAVWGLTDLMLNTKPVFAIAPSQVVVPSFDIAPHWPRGYAMKADGERVCALWSAFDKDMDVLYITAEHSRRHAEPTANAAAILARGKWMPGVLHPPLTRNLDELRAHLAVWINLGLTRLDLGDRSIEAGITDMHDRLATGRLRIFAHCSETITEYQSYRRDEEGAVLGEGLMDCARLLCRPSTIGRMIVKPHDAMLIGTGVVGPADDELGY